MKPEIELLLWTVEQIAEACGLSQGFVKKEIREGRLVAQKVGRLTRVSRAELDAWIMSNPVKHSSSCAGLKQMPARYLGKDGSGRQIWERLGSDCIAFNPCNCGISKK